MLVMREVDTFLATNSNRLIVPSHTGQGNTELTDLQNGSPWHVCHCNGGRCVLLCSCALFSDKFIMFAGHHHRYADGSVVPGKFGDCVSEYLNDQLAAARR